MGSAQVQMSASEVRLVVAGPPLVAHALVSLLGEEAVLASTGFLAHLPALVARTQPDTALIHAGGLPLAAVDAVVRQLSHQAPAVRLLALLGAETIGEAGRRLGGLPVTLRRTDCEPAELLALLAEPSPPAELPPLHLVRPVLTARERDVLHWAARGMTNRAIGRRLQISEFTVKNHLRHVHSKLGVQSRTEAIMRAAQLGLLELPVLPEGGPPVPAAAGT